MAFSTTPRISCCGIPLRRTTSCSASTNPLSIGFTASRQPGSLPPVHQPRLVYQTARHAVDLVLRCQRNRLGVIPAQCAAELVATLELLAQFQRNLLT